MLTFFRKIRKSLIDSGSAKKYTLYAIGEIFLVMIGILLALQVNNWNQNRMNKNKEHSLLKEINTEFIYNKEELRNTIGYYDRVRQKYSRLIASFPIQISTYNVDSLSVLLKGTNATLDVDISQGSINTLINSSSFEIISNLELRTLLLQWNDLVSNYKEAESLLINFTADKFFPYLDERIPIAYAEGIKEDRIDLSFLSSVKFENMIKRRRQLINNMIAISEFKDGHLMNTIDRIILLSTIIEE
jgi:hypothetical protein